MEPQARIYVAGMETLLGSALVRVLSQHGYANLVGGAEGEPDPTDGAAVDAFFGLTRPEYVFMTGGPSGGILANQKYPATLMRENVLADTHIIHSAYRHHVRKLLYLASSCCYPRECPQPMRVESLMTGWLEPTSEAYATAKLAGIGLCRAHARQYGVHFVAAIPADAFGPGDDFSPEDSHVVPGLIKRMHEAKVAGVEVVDIWGSGRPRRELMWADDVADASLFVMRHYGAADPINLGGGTPVTIADAAKLISEVVGFSGRLGFDTTKPDGMPVKVLDSGPLLRLGWRPKTPLREAIQATYEWFLRQEAFRVATRGSVRS